MTGTQNPALPPLPDIEDGEGRLGSDVRGVFLYPDVGVRVHMQAAEDGAYRTSILSIGGGMNRLDVFAKRDQIERLHRLLGQHLEQLDAYESALYVQRLERNGLDADVPDDVKQAWQDAGRAEPRTDMPTEAEIDAFMNAIEEGDE